MNDKITKALETVNELHGETLKKLDDDALIDAMARASAECSPKDWLYADDWFKNKYIEQSIAALSVCRPIIERETRERCVSVTNGLIAELRAENEKLKKENWEHIARGYALLSLLPPETTCGQVQEARAKFAAAAGLKETKNDT